MEWYHMEWRGLREEWVLLVKLSTSQHHPGSLLLARMYSDKHPQSNPECTVATAHVMIRQGQPLSRLASQALFSTSCPAYSLFNSLGPISNAVGLADARQQSTQLGPPVLRPYSIQPSSPSLKAKTRQLLKKVHPDLFAQHPEARAANERSFKLLQEYLAAAKTGGGIGRTAGLPYHFTFYIHEREQGVGDSLGPAAGAAEAAAAEGSEGQPEEPSAGVSVFKKVALTLPPPTKGGPGDALSPSTRKAFSRLLAACGINDVLSDDSAQAHHYSRLISLREFVPQAAEQVHQAAAQQAGPRQRLGALRTALRLGRNVTLAFAEPIASAGPVSQLAAGEQLVGVLDGLPCLDVGGLRVTVGEAYGVDALGTIWLHAGDSAQAWSRYLSGIDTAHCHERQALLRQVRAQEAAVARALKVGMVYTHPQLSLDPAYLSFLERVAAEAGARGPVAGGCLHDVPVMVHPDPTQALDGEEEHGQQGPGQQHGAGPGGGRAGAGAGPGADPLAAPSVDDLAGVVLVPVSTLAPALYSVLAALGPKAQAAMVRARQEEAATATLRSSVERKLRLRRLSKAGDLAPERFRAACLRLMQHSAELTPLLGGLAIRVAEVNGLPPDRSWVDIAWNFEL